MGCPEAPPGIRSSFQVALFSIVVVIALSPKPLYFAGLWLRVASCQAEMFSSVVGVCTCKPRYFGGIRWWTAGVAGLPCFIFLVSFHEYEREV